MRCQWRPALSRARTPVQGQCQMDGALGVLFPFRTCSGASKDSQCTQILLIINGGPARDTFNLVDGIHSTHFLSSDSVVHYTALYCPEQRNSRVQILSVSLWSVCETEIQSLVTSLPRTVLMHCTICLSVSLRHLEFNICINVMNSVEWNPSIWQVAGVLRECPVSHIGMLESPVCSLAGICEPCMHACVFVSTAVCAMFMLMHFFLWSRASVSCIQASAASVVTSTLSNRRASLVLILDLPEILKSTNLSGFTRKYVN